jgi:hypothetical protein
MNLFSSPNFYDSNRRTKVHGIRQKTIFGYFKALLEYFPWEKQKLLSVKNLKLTAEVPSTV